MTQSKEQFEEATPSHTVTVLLAAWTIIRNISLWFPQMILDWLFPWSVLSSDIYISIREIDYSSHLSPASVIIKTAIYA